jgi:hypothetical protein
LIQLQYLARLGLVHGLQILHSGIFVRALLLQSFVELLEFLLVLPLRVQLSLEFLQLLGQLLVCSGLCKQKRVETGKLGDKVDT